MARAPPRLARKESRVGNTHVVIRVQNRHISGGVGATPTACPIALAMREQLSVREACVGGRFFWLTDSFGYMTPDLELPVSAQRFVSKFDNAETVKPFEFRVEVPTEVVRA